MKACSKCSQLLDLSNFSKDKQKSDGYASHCKQCRLDASRKRRGVLPERYFANQKTYADNAEKQRIWKLKNPEKYAASLSLRDKEKARDSFNRWRAKCIEAQRSRCREWAKKNPEKAAQNSAKRRAAKLSAYPIWANKFFIEQAYDLARKRTEVMGVRYVVDHIVPLQSKFVCGLHVEHNLRVIPEAANATKGNRWWPDMG